MKSIRPACKQCQRLLTKGNMARGHEFCRPMCKTKWTLTQRHAALKPKGGRHE